MMVRDAAISDIVPKMTRDRRLRQRRQRPPGPYNLGHAVFEFIEAKYGKEGVRQFIFSLRKSVIGGGEDAYEEALKMKKDEFDQAFERYLKERFKPFRDKERPADYGRDLAPNREKTKYIEAISITASPSGDLLAVMTFNRKDGEIDVILMSSKDGSIVRNLTDGFDKDMGFDHITQNGERPEMPWMSWSPKGDRLAFFVRTKKERALLIQNVLTKKIEERIPMTTVDEPESPSFSPDGQTVAFSALRKAVGDIYTINLATKEVVNLTNDAFADFAPTFSPDGKFVIYNARVSGNQKLFRLDLDTKKKTQITFGTVDETDAKFVDDHTIVFSSTATDPERAARARRGEERQHLQRLDARLEERRAAPVHRRRGRQLVGRGAERRPDRAGSRSSATTKATTRSTRSNAKSRCTRPPRPTSARRAHHRLPGAAAAHARGRQRPHEEVSSRRCSSRAGRR